MPSFPRVTFGKVSVPTGGNVPVIYRQKIKVTKGTFFNVDDGSFSSFFFFSLFEFYIFRKAGFLSIFKTFESNLNVEGFFFIVWGKSDSKFPVETSCRIYYHKLISELNRIAGSLLHVSFLMLCWIWLTYVMIYYGF